MERGIPVVATNHGGLIEIIKNKETGYLVDIDVFDIADKLIKLIDDKELRNKFSEFGYNDVMENFSLERTIGDLETLFDKCL